MENNGVAYVDTPMLRHIFQIRDSISTQELDFVLIPLKVLVISLLSHDSVYNGTVCLFKDFLMKLWKGVLGGSTTTRKKKWSMNWKGVFTKNKKMVEKGLNLIKTSSFVGPWIEKSSHKKKKKLNTAALGVYI